MYLPDFGIGYFGIAFANSFFNVANCRMFFATKIRQNAMLVLVVSFRKIYTELFICNRPSPYFTFYFSTKLYMQNGKIPSCLPHFSFLHSSCFCLVFVELLFLTLLLRSVAVHFNAGQFNIYQQLFFLFLFREMLSVFNSHESYFSIKSRNFPHSACSNHALFPFRNNKEKKTCPFFTLFSKQMGQKKKE